MTASGPALIPVTRGARIELLDVLRGFAIFGILLVNFGGGPGEALYVLDAVVLQWLDLLVLGSFYPIFSLLFGIGVALQMKRAEARGTRGTGLYLRRMAVLFIIGTVHAVVIWGGDILVAYSLYGLLLVPARRVPLRLMLVVIPVLVVLGLFEGPIRERVEVLAASSSATERHREILAFKTQREEFEILRNIRLREGRSLGNDVAYRWRAYGVQIARYRDWMQLLTRDLLSLFLMGFYIGRRGWLEGMDSRLSSHRIGVLAVAVAAAGLATRTVPAGWVAVREVGVLMANYGVAACYISLIAATMGRSGRAAKVLRRFGPVGRMALTNYLAQSVVMTWLFLPYGLGLPLLSASPMLLVHLAFFFLVQMPFSEWWLARFRFGPIEWVWRSITYGGWQPVRVVRVDWMAFGRPGRRGEKAPKDT